MMRRITRRSFLKGMGTVGAGFLLAPTILAQDKKDAPAEKPKNPAGGPIYTFVNKTNGKFKDNECFWSSNGGGTWHSFAKEPTAPRGGHGRLYFCLGKPPKNFDDWESYWDFIECYAGGTTWYGNTTQVDAFCIPLTIELGDKKMGISELRSKLFAAFRREAPKEFQACVKGDFWIVSPCKAGFDKNGPNSKYFDKYVDEVWEMYAEESKTPSGEYTGKVVNGTLTFTPLKGGKAASCAKKPSTQEILLGEGVLGAKPQFCAAFNRHVAADPADWNNAAKFYQAEPCNWYSKFLHEHSIDHKAFGFCYDDVSEQAAYFPAKGDNLIVTLYWDSEPAAKPDKK